MTSINYLVEAYERMRKGATVQKCNQTMRLTDDMARKQQTNDMAQQSTKSTGNWGTDTRSTVGKKK